MNLPTNRSMNPLQRVTRRQLFGQCGVGVGKIALASLLASQALLGNRPAIGADVANQTLHPTSEQGGLHHPAKAKRVIYLFMAGAPSQLDLFDYKPKLVEWEGKPIPPSVIAGQRYAFIQPDAAVLAPRFKFQQHGKSGQPCQTSCLTRQRLSTSWRLSKVFIRTSSITLRRNCL